MTDVAQILTAWDASLTPADDGHPVAAAAALAAEAPRLRRLVHRLLGWPAQASEVDDVVQETLLAAWRHRDEFRGDAQWTTWLHRIALRKAQNHVRSSAVRKKLFGWFAAAAAEPVARCEASAGDERLSTTHAALQTLAHGDREVLVLRYLEQREIEQIAELLRCSRAAVDARLSRRRCAHGPPPPRPRPRRCTSFARRSSSCPSRRGSNSRRNNAPTSTSRG